MKYIRLITLCTCVASVVACGEGQTFGPDDNPDAPPLRRTGEPCESSSQCLDSACIQGVCRRVCTSSDNCFGDDICTSSGICRTSCTSEAQCAAGEICSSGACLPDPTLTACTGPRDCGPQESCQGGVCVPQNPVNPTVGCTAGSMEIDRIEGTKTLIAQPIRIIGDRFAGTALDITINGVPAVVSSQDNQVVEVELPASLSSQAGARNWTVEVEDTNTGCKISRVEHFVLFRAMTPVEIQGQANEALFGKDAASLKEDLDSDGSFELVLVSSTEPGRLTVVNPKTGVHSYPSVAMGDPWGPQLTQPIQTECNWGIFPQVTSVTDLNGDNVRDIIVGDHHLLSPAQQGWVCMYSGVDGQPLGSFGLAPNVNPVHFGCGVLDLGDRYDQNGQLGSDGVGDFAVASCIDATIEIFSGGQVLGLLASSQFMTPLYQLDFGDNDFRLFTEMVLVPDEDGDGHEDIVVIDSKTTQELDPLVLFLSGSFAAGGAPTTLQTPHQASSLLSTRSRLAYLGNIDANNGGALVFGRDGDGGRLVGGRLDSGVWFDLAITGLPLGQHNLLGLPDVTGDDNDDLVVIAGGDQTTTTDDRLAILSGRELVAQNANAIVRSGGSDAGQIFDGLMLIPLGDINGDGYIDIAYSSTRNDVDTVTIRSLDF